MPQSQPSRSHLWVVGATHRDRAAALAGGSVVADVAVDCHRGLRGPYTGTGSLLRALIPAIAENEPALLEGRVQAVLCAAPEVEPFVGSAPETLTALAPHDERTRWYSLQRTVRIANHLVDLLEEYGRARPASLTVFFDTAHHADPTDREFLAVALRRLDPASVRVVVGSTTDAAEPTDPAEPAGQSDDGLAAALARHAHRIDAPSLGTSAPHDPDEDLARAHVAEDGAGDDAATLAAYEALSPGERARLHDLRAEELAASGEYSLRLGAIPYHRHRGADPLGKAWPLYAAAEGYCMSMGYYPAVLEQLDRLEELAVRYDSRRHDLQQHSAIRRGQILSLLGRPAQAEANYFAALAATRVPRQVMSLHYALGMLYTRWRPDPQRDHDLATAYLNTAVAIGSQLENDADRAFYTAFMSNGLALARMHAGFRDEALDLVEGALDLLAHELVPEKHRLHRSVLRHNRAQLLSALGRPAEALADLDEVVSLDPHYPEYRFDRGNLRFQTGDAEGALADYAQAELLGPPFVELFHNRAEVLAALGDLAGAVRSLDRALELDPTALESVITLASLLLDAGLPDRPADTVAALVREGLEAHPDQPRLLFLLGRALAEMDDAEGAVTVFDRALSLDPSLHPALVARAVLAFGAARYAEALRDLDAAVALAGDDPDLLYNRGCVHEALGDPRSALTDYLRALTLPGCDADLLQEQVEACRKVLSEETAGA